jgi:hypothetical protein
VPRFLENTVSEVYARLAVVSASDDPEGLEKSVDVVLEFSHVTVDEITVSLVWE